MIYPENSCVKLSEEVRKRLSEKRFNHTVSVAECAVKLADFCEPESKFEAEIASLLHDITKEHSADWHIDLLTREKYSLDSEDVSNPGVLHSFTAPYVIKSDFREYANDKILSAARNHTLGAPEMTVLDEIVFLADFIEETRTYDASVELRKYVYGNMKDGQIENNVLILHKACIIAIEKTVINLINTNKPINSKNILTRNALLGKI